MSSPLSLPAILLPLPLSQSELAGCSVDGSESESPISTTSFRSTSIESSSISISESRCSSIFGGDNFSVVVATSSKSLDDATNGGALRGKLVSSSSTSFERFISAGGGSEASIGLECSTVVGSVGTLLEGEHPGEFPMGLVSKVFLVEIRTTKFPLDRLCG